MVWDRFSWHTLGPLIPSEHTQWAYRGSLSTFLWFYDYSVPAFCWLFNRIECHVTKLRLSRAGFLKMKMSWMFLKGLHIYYIWIQWRTFGEVVNRWTCNWQIQLWCYHFNMDQNLWKIYFPVLCWFSAMKKGIRWSSQGKRSSTLGTRCT